MGFEVQDSQVLGVWMELTPKPLQALSLLNARLLTTCEILCIPPSILNVSLWNESTREA